MTMEPTMQLSRWERLELQTLAARLYKADWPEANWLNHFKRDAETKSLNFCTPDAAARRYRLLASIAREWRDIPVEQS